MGVTIGRAVAAVVATVVFSFHCNAQPESVATHPIRWPAATSCNACVPLQFGELLMKVPLAEIEKIAVLGSDLSALHVVPKGKTGKDLITFLSIPRTGFVGRYEEGKLIARELELTNKRLLDLMFVNSKVPNHPSGLIRIFEGIDKASELRTASRNGLHLYWIKRARPEIDHIYVVIDGSETTYLVAGEISNQLFDGIWSNMHRASLP